jgi:hypothetical protein
MGRRSTHNYLKSCQWKARYTDYLAAEQARLEKQRIRGVSHITYLCRYCRNWHLSSHF